MADSILDGTPKEPEDSQKTEEIPASPHVNTSKEPTMEELTDDEIILTDPEQRAKHEDEEIFHDTLPLDGGVPNVSPPRPARVLSPLRPPLPPISPRGAAPAFQFPQDIRIGTDGTVRPKVHDQRPPGFYGMPPVTLTREQQDFRDIQQVLHAQGSQLEILRGSMQGIGDKVRGVESHVSIMNGAFQKIMADNVNAMRAVTERVSRLETGMEGLCDQMRVLQNMMENITQHQSLFGNASMENNTSGGINPVLNRTSPQHGSATGDVFVQEDPPTTPVRIPRPPVAPRIPMDTLPSLPSSGFRHLRYEDDLHSTAQVNDEIAHMNRSLPHQSSSLARSRRTDLQDLGQSTFSSSHGPKVPKFDGKGPFVPWLVQFRAVAGAHGWDNSEKAVHLVAALEGSATGLLHGVTMVQMDNYDFLVERLRNRYDPVGRESTFRTQLTNRTRRHGETADEFAESIALLAQRAHPNYEISAGEDDPITSCIVDRFCSGQCNPELSSYLALYPSRDLSDLIGACVRWEATQVKKSFKPVDTVYAVKDITPQSKTLTQEEMETFARQHGYTVRPIARQDTYRYPEAPRQDAYRRQNDTRPMTGGTRPPPRDKRQVLCWHCGTYGHFSRECTGKDKTFRWAPPRCVSPTE